MLRKITWISRVEVSLGGVKRGLAWDGKYENRDFEKGFRNIDVELQPLNQMIS
jgi:hypothetical protein